MGCKAFAFRRLPGLRSAVGALAVGRMVSVGILLGVRARQGERRMGETALSPPPNGVALFPLPATNHLTNYMSEISSTEDDESYGGAKWPEEYGRRAAVLRSGGRSYDQNGTGARQSARSRSGRGGRRGLWLSLLHYRKGAERRGEPSGALPGGSRNHDAKNPLPHMPEG